MAWLVFLSLMFPPSRTISCGTVGVAPVHAGRLIFNRPSYCDALIKRRYVLSAELIFWCQIVNDLINITQNTALVFPISSSTKHLKWRQPQGCVDFHYYATHHHFLAYFASTALHFCIPLLPVSKTMKPINNQYASSALRAGAV